MLLMGRVRKVVLGWEEGKLSRGREVEESLGLSPL